MDETFQLAPIGTCAPEDTQFIFVTATLPQVLYHAEYSTSNTWYAPTCLTAVGRSFMLAHSLRVLVVLDYDHEGGRYRYIVRSC